MASTFPILSSFHLFNHYHILASGFSGHVIHRTPILHLLTTCEGEGGVLSIFGVVLCVSLGPRHS